ncbi:NADH-cytochrome b5 reductase-like isoform X2 [Neocloeon triangulifer]|nr:NADH-cytochrome b5 reductase-like isoform X2 [Neocloeon triangulifer]XP_059479049.1 NADH-cytochrome b5 reductase-like isoform X2 [Neocloeon triangulifer]XP_059479050.1 NADH-cytochrome b5 reductase-like isoform X2 [Neocloeon triangulifer]
MEGSKISVDEDDLEPEEPKAEDCCGEGCNPCVYDIYRNQLKKYQSRKIQVETSISLGLSQTDFLPFQLIEIKDELEDTAIYRFQSIDLIELGIGKHLELKVPLIGDIVDDKPNFVDRKYSPIAWTSNTFDVIVKRYENGPASEYLARSKVGDTMQWRGPYGDFQYEKTSQEVQLILCAGTGIAPMIPIISSILENEHDETVLKLYCGCPTLKSRLLLSKLKEFAAFWNFSFTHFVTSDEGEPDWGEKVVRRRIEEIDIQNAIENATKCRVLICGPDSFCDDMKNFVTKVGANFYCF